MAVVGKPSKIGKYAVIEVLGEGGMGAVYKAVDPRIGRTVAIKVIKGDFAEDPELLRRFDIEARAVGNLQHPNIVTVYDFGEENGSPYLVMQYLDGTPLDKVIAHRQNLGVIQKLDIIIGVLKALDYAHEHGVIHRDVKPANVQVLKDGSVKLLDFGIAREGNLGQTKTGQVMGTMFYMPPEQMSGEVVDRRGDIFSTGIMLFELLAYSLPFEARDQTSIVVQRLRGDAPPPLSKYFDNYPLELDGIIARAMMRDRDERYSRAEDFAFDLARVQERLKRERASHYVDQARALIAKSDLVQARDLLSEVIRIDTQNSTAKQLHYEVQQLLQAQQRAERVQHLRIQAEDALVAKQLQNAADLVEQAIKIDKNDLDLLDLREKIHEAKARAEQVLKLLKSASAAQQLEQFEVAQKAVADALALDASDTDAKVMQAAIARQLVEHEKRNRVQQLLQVARREISARQYESARDNISKAKAIDPGHPEILGLEKLVTAGQLQERRQAELLQACAEIERRLLDNNLAAARDLAGNSLRKFPGEERLIRLKAAADDAYEQEERRLYIEQQIVSASRFVEKGQASNALTLLQDVERLYPANTRLVEYMKVVREAAARETAERDKKAILFRASAAIRRQNFTEAIDTLERGLLQFPGDVEIAQQLETTRNELDRANEKKQVEEASRQARQLLETKAHTDAIDLLERSVAQVSDPDLIRLLEHARKEAAEYRAGMKQASEQATQMLDEGRHSEALRFLEIQVEAYGKNTEFQALLNQARTQVERAQQATQRLLRDVSQARLLLRSGNLQEAETILSRCQSEAPSEPEVMALTVEIEEERKAVERRRLNETVQQFLQAARREIGARQLEAAQENIGKAKAIDPAHPEIPGLEKMILTGQEQQRRRAELQQVCAEIEQCLVDNKLNAARDLAGKSLRKFPGEERLIRLKAAAEEAYEQEQRRLYIEQQILSASRLVGDGQASSALKLLQDAERLYPAHPRLLEYMKVVREAAAREGAEREKKGMLSQAAAAIRRESFAEAINTLEGGLLQFPADAEIRELLKATRDELDRANQRKRVEEVGRQARQLLETKAHTDAINLLERSVAQVTDPDLVRLLEYARREAADYDAGLQNASVRATKMLDEARPAEAVSFLETQVGAYGKDAKFQALLSKARTRFEDAQQEKKKIFRDIEHARSLMRSGDLHAAEAIFHRCQPQASSEPAVIALGNEIEEEKEAVERRRQEEAERQARKTKERAAEYARPVPSDPAAGTKIFPEGAESRASPLHQPPASDASLAHIKTGKDGRLEHETVAQHSEGVFQRDLSEVEEESAKHERRAPLPLKMLIVASLAMLLATGAFFAKRWFDHRPPAPPKQFEVKIESDPPHAVIHIKGSNLMCETPCSGLMLPPGDFEMEATLENYQTMTQPVKIPDQVRVRFNLDPVSRPEKGGQATSMVNILIQTVVGALVTVDDEQYRTKNDGTLRLSVAANSTLRIRGQKEGFKPREEVVPVGGDNLRVSLELTPDLVTVLIRKAPPGATVLVDEKPQATVAKDGMAKFPVTAGDHGFALSTASGTAPPVSRSAKAGQILTLDSLPVPSSVAVKPPPTDTAESEWEGVKDSNNPAELQSFLDHHPVSPHADAARSKIDQLDGNSALSAGSRPRLLDYLNKHPNGQYVEQCRIALDELDWKVVENSNDLAKLQEFVDSHPTSRFKSQALAKIADVQRSTAPVVRDTNNDSNAIQTVLKTYAGALQDRNRLRLRHVYPGLDDKSFDRMKQSFDNAESIKVQLKITNGPVIDGNGTTAHVSCDQLIEVKTHGETQSLPRTVLIFSLVKDNGEWIIDNVTRPR